METFEHISIAKKIAVKWRNWNDKWFKLFWVVMIIVCFGGVICLMTIGHPWYEKTFGETQSIKFWGFLLLCGGGFSLFMLIGSTSGFFDDMTR